MIVLVCFVFYSYQKNKQSSTKKNTLHRTRYHRPKSSHIPRLLTNNQAHQMQNDRLLVWVDHLHGFGYKSISLLKSFSPIHDSTPAVMSVRWLRSTMFVPVARSPFLLLQYSWASYQVLSTSTKMYLSSPALVKHTPLMERSVCIISLLIKKQSKVKGYCAEILGQAFFLLV